MKFKLLVLLMALCLLLIGCNAADTKNTTAPSQPGSTIDYEDDTIIYEPIATGDPSSGSLDLELPEELQGIVLPEIELTDEDYLTPEPVPVTKPTETQPDEPEEPTEASEPKVPHTTVWDPDALPEDILE